MLTLSGLTANVALQVMLCPYTLSSGACSMRQVPFIITARLAWSTGSASLFMEQWEEQSLMLTGELIDRQQQDLCEKVRQCW